MNQRTATVPCKNNFSFGAELTGCTSSTSLSEKLVDPFWCKKISIRIRTPTLTGKSSTDDLQPNVMLRPASLIIKNTLIMDLSLTETHTLTFSYWKPCGNTVCVLCHSTKSKHLQSVIIWTQIRGDAELASNEGRAVGKMKSHQGRTECEIQMQMKRHNETERKGCILLLTTYWA